MKKLSLLFSAFILLTAFTCENEPLEGDFVTDEPNVTCEQALMNTATAAQNFAALNEENYEEEYSGACSALKTAFENQLEACGDPDGSLQAAIDALGNCNLNASPCEVATSAAAAAQQVLNQATEEEYADACNAYVFVLQQQINECGDADGSIQGIIDGLGDCNQGGGNVDNYALMTANLIGEQFDYMVPFFYPVFNKAVYIATFTGDDNQEKFLHIQGNTTPTGMTDFTKEVNLYIPESLWSVGTYTLDDDPFAYDSNNNTTPQANYNMIYNNGDGSSQTYELDNGGTITIIEFNLQDRIIRGTFEFTFTRYFVGTGEETGPFECLNGTFDYSLDDEYFD